MIFNIDSDANFGKLHEKTNLYNTKWGKYDFKSAVKKDSELKMSNYNIGREGWKSEHE